MRDLIATFSLPWYVWTMFGLIIGGVLISSSFRNDIIGLIAHSVGLRKRDRDDDE